MRLLTWHTGHPINRVRLSSSCSTAACEITLNFEIDFRFHLSLVRKNLPCTGFTLMIIVLLNFPSILFRKKKKLLVVDAVMSKFSDAGISSVLVLTTFSRQSAGRERVMKDSSIGSGFARMPILYLERSLDWSRKLRSATLAIWLSKVPVVAMSRFQVHPCEVDIP